jgi:tetratricopeptide (TPR) repeat protein
MDDLLPLIEVVHHACRAGAYDEAKQIQWERIDQRNRFVLGNVLEANETQLALMLEFFPDGDASQEPAVSKASDKTWILNEVGFCLMSLGRLDEAITFYERKTPIDLGLEDWSNASVGYRNLAVLHIRLGVLATAAEAAREALALAHRAENKEDERNSLAWQAWIAHLRGDMATAGADFQQAEALEQEINSNERYLYSGRGIWHADHLRRAGDADYARRVTDANVKSCEEYHWPQFLSQSHRVLGDLDADAGQHDSARSHYDEALKLARSISRRDVLIEALLARGLWYAKYQQDAPAAFSDLNEVFGYATEGGFRIHEADIRVALAWAHLDAGDRGLARNEATRAQAMSAEMGYHWGQVDAAEVLAKIEDSSAQ